MTRSAETKVAMTPTVTAISTLAAAAILALSDEALADRLADWRERQTTAVMDDPSNADEVARVSS